MIQGISVKDVHTSYFILVIVYLSLIRSVLETRICLKCSIPGNDKLHPPFTKLTFPSLTAGVSEKIRQFLPHWYLVFAFFSVAGNFLQAREGKSVAWCEKAWPELELNRFSVLSSCLDSANDTSKYIVRVRDVRVFVVYRGLFGVP